MEAALAALYEENPAVLLPNMHVPVCGSLLPSVQAHCMPYCGGHGPECYPVAAPSAQYVSALGSSGARQKDAPQQSGHGERREGSGARRGEGGRSGLALVD